jgi:hypothetical protein
MRKKIWWGLLAVGFVAIIAGLVMRRSADLNTQQWGATIGWTGVALAVASRVILRMLPKT